MHFEKLRFRFINRGGTEDDPPIEQIIDDHIQECSRLVLEPNRQDKATISITVTIENIGENSVAVGAKVVAKEPHIITRSITGNIDRNGDVVTFEHKQGHFDFTAPKQQHLEEVK